MSPSVWGVVLVGAYAVGCMAYVFMWRGSVRYASFAQYLRKSWPVFAPLNCLMYMTTRSAARRPVLDADYLAGIERVRQHWTTIRDEALALQAAGAFEAAKAPGSVGYYDVGFRTFYKRGWSKFYLKWYGTTHNSARRLCPETAALLSTVPGIRGAMFSILPPGGELSLHSDPMACSLRYHLGLATPNSALCQIVVDGQPCTWHDGEDFVFDETYPHQAHNRSDQSRLILLCDVDRPMNLLGCLFRQVYLVIASGTLVPNTPEDRRGIYSRLFAHFAPLRARSLQFRQLRPRLYRALKLLLNTSLGTAFMASLFVLFSALERVLAWTG